MQQVHLSCVFNCLFIVTSRCQYVFPLSIVSAVQDQLKQNENRTINRHVAVGICRIFAVLRSTKCAITLLTMVLSQKIFLFSMYMKNLVGKPQSNSTPENNSIQSKIVTQPLKPNGSSTLTITHFWCV